MNPLAQKLTYITSQLRSLSSFQSEVTTVCQHLDYSQLRIAVFAPFNHGKSTLLNAVLGNRTLPVNLTPTTGTAITIKHGKSLNTRIQLQGGNEVARSGTEMLQEYAILDGDRRMREDVESIEVSCPHPLLAKGVELIDLPGTSDMEAQDELVFKQLLTADLIISVLDARKLLTMAEIDKLQEWLLKRGIKTVIFVLNFTNLIETTEEHQEIMNRARFIAREFRGNLPNNVSNLYRVDALPALRARVKGDENLARQSGLLTFDNALHQIVDLLLPQLEPVRLPKIYALSDRVKQSLERELQALKKEIGDIDRDRNREIEQGRKGAKQMKSIFETSVQNVKNWLSTESFISRYHESCLQALLSEQLFEFQNASLRDTLVDYIEVCDRLIEQACERFEINAPDEIEISLPDFPDIDLPETPIESNEEDGSGTAAFWGGVAGFFMGGPLGAAAGAAGAAALVSNSAKQRRAQLLAEHYANVKNICDRAVRKYLKDFSENVLEALSKYENSITVFSYRPPIESSDIRDKRKKLNQIQLSLNELYQF